MDLNRRSFASLFGGVAGLIGAKQLGLPGGNGMPNPINNLGAGMFVGAKEQYNDVAQTMSTPSIMSEQQATKLAMKIPHLRDLIISSAYGQNRNISHIDPDLMVLKSFSPMAKLTFQRQRNVQRYIKEMTTEPSWKLFEPLHKFIRTTMWRR